MVSNTNGGAPPVLVLYKVTNSDSDPEGSLYNAFQMPRGNGLTLAAVKHHCSALRHLSHMGPDGFHWRVCVDEKPAPGATKSSSFTWWDIQDENARLPVKEASTAEVQRMFMPTKHSHSSGGDSASATKAAKGAFKSLGKAISGAVDHHHGDDHGPRVSVVAFKLLDLVRMHEDFTRKHGGASAGHAPAAPRGAPKPTSRAAASPAPRAPRPPTRAAAAPVRSQSQPHQPRQQAARQSAPVRPGVQPQRRAAPQQQEPSLMDFGTSAAPAGRKLSHSASMPAAFANETKAERLKRQYAEQRTKQKKVWDEVDQRWVVLDENATGVKGGGTSAPPASAVSAAKSKTVGISLDESNVIGKSAEVADAVGKRVAEMRESQAKALQEVKDRESRKKQAEEEEDAARKRLEPKIKAWSEEHGKKKQLRALLANLHTILWPEAKWKQVSIGDILDNSKVKKFYHKASRVVHPDKTHDLSAENRFLAKRIFDALSQAWTEFNEQSS